MKGGTRRVVAGALGVAALVGLACVPAPEQSEAAWVDVERATATVSAIDVPEVVANAVPECTATGLLNLAPTVQIWWKLPPEAIAAGYTVADAEYGQILNSGLLEPILSNLLSNVTTTTSGTGYRTTIGGTLLADLLGGKKTLGIRLVRPGPAVPAPVPDTRWRSDWFVAVAEFRALGLGGNICNVTTAPSY